MKDHSRSVKSQCLGCGTEIDEPHSWAECVAVLRAERDRLGDLLLEAVRKEDLEYALERVGRLNNAVRVLYRVFEAAAVLSDVWPGSSPNWEALREAVEGYRQLVAPLPDQGGTGPGKPPVQP